MNHKNKLFLVLTMPFLASVLCFIHNDTSVSAYTATLTTSNSISLDALPSHDGVAIDEESINVTTTCQAGYNLAIATSTSSDLYLNGDDSSTATFTAVDGTSTLNNSENKWGFTLTDDASASTVFSPLSTTASVLKTPAGTASQTDIDDTFSIYYGTKVAPSVTPGSYQMADSGAIVYYLTMDPTCITYTVEFNPNGGTGTVADQEIQPGVSTKLTSSNAFTAPTGASYTDADNNTITGDADKLWTFWGWNTEIDGSGDWYKEREAVTDLELAYNTITLYAQWKQPTLADLTTSSPVGTEKTIDHNTMQDMSPATCYNSDKFTAIGTPYGQATLTDRRDGVNKTYAVAKLPDNFCWMTQNLNLGTSIAITLTPDDTDITKNFTLPASNPTNFATGTGQANINKATILNNMTVPDYTVNSTTYTGKINAYYSYAAATADTSTYSKGSSTTKINTSICPKNWNLPTNTQYYNLRTAGSIATYNNTDASYIGKNAGNEPYYFIYGGYRKAAGDTISTTTFNNPATYGYLWTANNYNSTSGRSTYVYSSGLYNSSSATTSYKYYGLSMRCVASMGEANITYYANNGSDSTSTKNVEITSGSLASASLFPAASNQQFKEWNTSADGTGTSYAAGASIISTGLHPAQSLELYAIWDDLYYISFDANESSVGENPGSATGNMSKQTIIRGTPTAISTSAFALSGYIFYGWNTAADGTGTPYNDRQKVTNLTSAGSTITLYAVWVEGAYLDTGQNVNQKLKRLAGNSSATYFTQDTTITAIVRSNTLPNDFTPSAENTISDSSSPSPIYAWYDSTNTTIYYYSEASAIFMNKGSSYFFYQMRTLSNLATISTWDTIKVTTMYQLFYNTGYDVNSFTLDLSSWNTSNVTNMAYTFYYAGYSATTWSVGNLSSWNTSSVTNMFSMFSNAGYNATSFILDLSSWDTSSVVVMQNMLNHTGYSATTWSVGDLSSWNTSRVTSMDGMFCSAGYSATTWSVGDLSSWDTSSVANMTQMFYNAGYSATTWSIGNLSSWDTSSVANMTQMFYNAGYSATTFSLNLSSWNTSSVTNMTSMFYSAGYSATTWSVTIPKTNDGTALGPIPNTTSNLYGRTTSTTATPPSGKSFTLAN